MDDSFAKIRGGTQLVNSVLECVLNSNLFFLDIDASMRFINILVAYGLDIDEQINIKHQRVAYLIKQIHPGISCCELKFLSTKMALFCIQEIFSKYTNKKFDKPFEDTKVTLIYYDNLLDLIYIQSNKFSFLF